ncbi:multi-sensor hybrid histidine kinase [Pseudomonas psychrotolerans L19]|uniref:GAF domain-containing protein n=1 Tax=Pseudomonas TaxID=286 RepID=UPI00023A3DCB|nr:MULTISPECIES: hypothetical protein [Pseudomonas]EHK72484.1 multi-sensor hybrid histidine kinase [Pseudomonas psychrotolerans L19]MBA1179721.1 hypothetical protein [Pseudomonas psychrotolerans]
MADSLKYEDDRLNALHALELLDSAPAEEFDRLCELVASSFNVPTALISLVDRDRQWFKARVGFDLAQMPIEDAFCAHTIQAEDGRMEINDACCDTRFSHNPLVVSPPMCASMPARPWSPRAAMPSAACASSTASRAN